MVVPALTTNQAMKLGFRWATKTSVEMVGGETITIWPVKFLDAPEKSASEIVKKKGLFRLFSG